MGRKILASLLVIAFVIVAVVAVQAQPVTKAPKVTRTPKKDPTVVAQRCADLTAKIDKKIERFNTSSDHPALTKVIQKTTDLVTTLKAQNVDVSKLETDLATLKTKNESCKIAYGQFIAKLTTTKSFACGQSQGEFATALQAARAEKEKAKTGCQDTKTFMRTTVKTDLQTLKQQLKTAKKLSVTPTP